MMLLKAATSLLLVALIWSVPQQTFSHPGGTNAEGCHTDHRTGDYHCHTPKTPSPSTPTYCHVIRGERRCGYARSTCNDLVSQFGGSCQVQY